LQVNVSLLHMNSINSPFCLHVKDFSKFHWTCSTRDGGPSRMSSLTKEKTQHLTTYPGNKQAWICFRLLVCHILYTANELLARHKFLLAKLFVTFFAYRIANRVGVRPFLGGVRYSFSILTNMLVRSHEY
jgi:hypothetical protein